MIFRQLFEADTSTYTYLLACEQTKKAVFIDTVASQLSDYIRLLKELDLKIIEEWKRSS